jgi:hypothetical protein
MITTERVRELLDYDPETGALTWKGGGSRRGAGLKAGTASRHPKTGYVTHLVAVDKHKTTAARIIFLWMTGSFPPPGMVLDHINGDTLDNRWSNLRVVTHRGNMQNMKLHRQGKLPGCFFHANGWSAMVGHNREQIYLGRFRTELEAHTAYMAKLKEIGHAPT